MKFLLIPICIVLWCAGGQGWLWARRYVLAGCVTAYAYFANREEKKRKFSLIFLALIGLLSMGYGENSWLKRACRGSEIAVRVVMAGLIASLLATFIAFNHSKLWLIPIVYVLNILAWQVQTGSLGKIWGKDILIEDIARATALGGSILMIT